MGQLMQGGAHIAENGTIYGNPGDTTGREVSVAPFSASGWSCILRPTNPSHAAGMASAMINACNNDNIGYSQNTGSGPESRTAVITYGINASFPINCDCSSLVRACVIVGCGVDPGNFATSTEINALLNTGLFVKTDLSNPFNGDVLWRSGHTEIVVSGNPRAGADNEVTASIGSGASIIADIGESALQMIPGNRYSAVDGTYRPRLEAPTVVNITQLIEDLKKQKEEKNKKKKKKKKKNVSTDPTPEELREIEEKTDLWFTPTEWGGKSPFSYPPLTNESYAWGRFSEIMNDYSLTTQGSAHTVYRTSEDGYVRNMAPMLGAIMCFYGGKKHSHKGFVCVVESLDANGTLTTSEVKNGVFQTTVRTKRYGSWDDKEEGLVFQGFIQNPMCQGAIDESALETFLRIAEEHVGEGPEWACNKMNIQTNGGWSAAFVAACSSEAGSSLNIVIPDTASCTSIGRIGVLRHMGEWLPSNAQGKYAIPEVGDIVLFRRQKYSDKVETYVADGAGIVTQVNNQTITVIEGDVQAKKVIQTTYSKHANVISAYYRPNWEQIDGTTESVIQYRTIQGLYTEGVREEDAAAREIGYLTQAMKPSISQTGIKLTAINYTGLLQNMYSVFGAQLSTSDQSDAELIVDFWTNTVKGYYQQELLGGGLDMTQLMGGGSLAGGLGDLIAGGAPAVVASVNVTQNMLNSYTFLKSKGLSNAGAVAILANIQRESGFNTAAIGDHGTSGGLCQWHDTQPNAGRFTNMKNFCGAQWANNLSGQLNFLIHELQTGYKSVWSHLMSVPNSLAGAKSGADYFVRVFEVPADVDNESKTRQDYAVDIWNKVAS